MATNHNRPKPRTRNLRVAQINAGGAKSVIDELRKAASELRTDIILLQEPYSYKNKIPGLGLQTRILSDNKKFSKISTAERIKTAIVILDNNIDALKIEQLSNTHCVCAEIRTNNDSWYLVSAYLQYCEDIEPYLKHLDEVISTLKGQKIVISIDANAKSPTWFNDQTDTRGEAMEDFISQHSLFIVNKASATCTFNTPRGTSNIDLTLTSNSCFNRVNGWKVHDSATTSDHSLITFNLRVSNSPDKPFKTDRFNLRKADWEKFQRCITTSLKNTPLSPTGNPEALATKIETIIQTASVKSIPHKTKFSKSIPWWNSNLTTLRKEVPEARRAYQRTKTESLREPLRKEYNKLRNRYITEIRTAKITSWRNFVTKEGNANEWGLAYKLANRKLKVDKACESIVFKGEQTLTLPNTIEKLLAELVPDDNEENETDWHKSIREETIHPPDTTDSTPFLKDEIQSVIKKLKPNKSPGHDRIENETIKQSWYTLGNEITHLFNSCLSHGTFPSQWKRAQIKVLLKGEDKEVNDPRSYRPISLLPTLGKTLEKLVARRLTEILCLHPLASDRQFGFKPGKSTEDAIIDLRNKIAGTQQKYTIGLLFDISGAFDSVWWPSILNNLKYRNCPRNIYKLIQSYLSNRSAEIVTTSSRAQKTVNKGCPQGSILGPMFWNLVFDDLLNKLSDSGHNVTAYADDLIVLASGNSRLELEHTANSITSLICEWCLKQKLRLSTQKSEMILLKGLLDIRRPPTVKIGTTSLKMKPVVKYLGVKFGTRLNIMPHIHHISEKSKKTFNALATIAKANWGLNNKTLVTIYKGVFVPVATYAAAAWADRLNNSHHIRHLHKAQRNALIRITKAYRTISYNAVTVIAGAIPIELLLREREAIYKAKNNIDFKLGDLHYTTRHTAPSPDDLLEIKQEIRIQTEKSWQTTWDSTRDGRITYEFFPSITNRLNANWIHPNHYSTQILSGHGHIKNKLKALKISETDTCICGQPDSVHHIIFSCPLHDQHRQSLKKEILKLEPNWPCSLSSLTRQETYAHFNKFATDVINDRINPTQPPAQK